MVAYDVDEDFEPVARAMAVPPEDMNMRDWIRHQIDFNIFYNQEWVNNNLPDPEQIPENMTVEEYRQMEANNDNNNA